VVFGSVSFQIGIEIFFSYFAQNTLQCMKWCFVISVTVPLRNTCSFTSYSTYYILFCRCLISRQHSWRTSSARCYHGMVYLRVCLLDEINTIRQRNLPCNIFL